MSKKVLELSLSLFVVACTISLVVGTILLWPFLKSSQEVMDGSYSMLQSSTVLLNQIAEGAAEGKKAPGEMVKMLQSSNELLQQMTRTVAETRDAPKEFADLLKEIRLLVGEMQVTVAEAKKSQIEIAQSANVATDVLFELAIAAAASAMEEERILTPTDADEIIIESIKGIESHSERLGKLARSINDFRVRQRKRY